MAFPRPTLAMFLVCLLPLGFSSCLARRRLISRAPGSAPSDLRVADVTYLVDSVSHIYSAIRDFGATVDMVPALGSVEKNHITEYKDVTAYIRFRKPSDIRLIGLLPVVRNKAFDMASNGDTFKLYLPTRNQFITGRNEVVQPSANRWENLRPQHFLDALLVRPIDLNLSKVIIENFTDEDNAFYILHEIRESAGGQLRLTRTIWFNRVNLQLARQMIFDENGNILTDARYAQWHAFDNVAFPKHIEINRPRDEYAMVLDVVKMDINKGVPDDQFELPQPEGTTLKVIGPASPNSPPPPKKKDESIDF